MEDTTKVLDLLDELEDLLESAKSVPFSSKVGVEAEDIYGIIKDIRLALPDDMQQAKWIREERDRILNEARQDYEKKIREAKKQADYLVESDEITKRANKLSNEIIADAKINAKLLKMKTYDYVDSMLYEMQGKIDDISLKYVNVMFNNIDDTLRSIGETLSENRIEIKELAERTQHEEDMVSVSDNSK